jgi:hypothetical protein
VPAAPAQTRTKSDILDVLRENGGVSILTSKISRKPFLSQLGKNLVNRLNGYPTEDREYDKKCCLAFMSLKVYKCEQEITSMEELDSFLELNENKTNQRLAVSVVGQLLDFHSRFLLCLLS